MKNIFAAIDLGSTNCRISIVAIVNKKPKEIYRFSKIINLAKNLAFNNEFGNEKIRLTTKVFKKLSKKMAEKNVNSYKCIATHACREAINSEELIQNIYKNTGIKVQIISPYEEARLCLYSTLIHIKDHKKFNMIFDIGGGSTELIFIKNKVKIKNEFEFLSLPYGVISLNEKSELFNKSKINEEIKKKFVFFKSKTFQSEINMIGSCGTITSICSVFLGLQHYNRKKVEGVVMKIRDIIEVCEKIKKMSFEEKINHPCIGKQRSQLLDNGIIILEAIYNNWDINEILVSDRGLREGMIEEHLNQNED